MSMSCQSFVTAKSHVLKDLKTYFLKGLYIYIYTYISYWNGGRTMRVGTLRALAGGVSITSINRETNIDEIIEEVLTLWIGVR